MNWFPLSDSNRELPVSKTGDFANLSKRELGQRCRDSNPVRPNVKGWYVSSHISPHLVWGEAENRTQAFCFTDRLAATTLSSPINQSGCCRVVWVVGFEPTASAFQERPSTGLTIHPEMVGRGREVFI